MATYAIGDIQGCFDALLRLTAAFDFDPDQDELWLAGDLVNRGPANAEVLRWCIEYEPRLKVVLGNHDLHLMSCMHGLRKPKGRDTLQDVLQAPDRQPLIDFLYRQPLLHHERGYLMVHAGCPPTWSLEQAKTKARRAQGLLQGPAPRQFFERLRDAQDDVAQDMAALTRMRTVDVRGAPVFGFVGPPDEAPAGQVPWFDWPHRKPVPATVIFGHWAALGFMQRPGLLALDTGCVWGQSLTAVRLEDLTVFQVPG